MYSDVCFGSIKREIMNMTYFGRSPDRTLFLHTKLSLKYGQTQLVIVIMFLIRNLSGTDNNHLKNT